jgi:hypothetical protein
MKYIECNVVYQKCFAFSTNHTQKESVPIQTVSRHRELQRFRDQRKGETLEDVFLR